MAEIKEIDRYSLTPEERSRLIAETEGITDDSTSPSFKLKGDESPEGEETFKEAFEIETVKPGEKPKDENGDDEPGDNPGDETDPFQKIKEDTYKTLAESNPDFKSKFKNFDEWEASKKAPPPANDPKLPATSGQQTVSISDEQKEEIVLEKTYDAFERDPSVKNLLTKIGVNEVPTTLEQWQKLFADDQEKNGNQFYANQLLNKFNDTKTSIRRKTDEIIDFVSKSDERFESSLKTFAEKVEETVKKVHANITASEAAPLREKMEAFAQEALSLENGRPKHPEYFTLKNGIPDPNGNAIFAGFIAENSVMIADYAKLGAGKTKPKLKDELRKQTNNGGKSIKTLGNQGHNTGSSRKVYLDNPKDRQSLSSKERSKIIDALNEEIKNA